MKKALNTFVGKLPLPIFENYKTENSVFISATRRSGSTWVQEFLNRNKQYRLMFEPLHPFNALKELTTSNQHLYIHPEFPNASIIQSVDRILSGQKKGRWVDQYNKKMFVKERLIKSVRGNLLLPYICSNYPEIKVIFLIRHPYPTVLSRMNLKWKTLLDDFLNQAEYLNIDKEKLQSFIENKSLIEQHILSWCLEHWIPIRELNSTQLFTVFYEDLVLGNENVMRSMLAFVGQDESSYDSKHLSKPSKMVQSRSDKFNAPLETINRWQKKLSVEDKTKAESILSAFGFENLYEENSTRNISIDDMWNQVNQSKGIEGLQ